jgi:hypothetical protein
MSIFEQVIAQNFFVMGEDAVYTPADTGEPLNIKVMASRPDEVFTFQSTPVLSETGIFEIQVSDIPNPQEGDTLQYKGKTYIVQGDPQSNDPDRLIWRLNTRLDDEISD